MTTSGTMTPPSDGGRPTARARRVATGVALAGLLCASLAPAAGADGTEPRAVVTATTNQVLEVLAKADLSSDEKRRQVEDVVYASVDFATVSRLVLAQNWRRFSEAQQTEFVREFKAHLSRTYGRSIDSYKNEQVEILGDRPESRGDWTVRAKVVRAGADSIRVDYRLRASGGTWRIIDIIVEGVSLVANFRSQFQGIVTQGGPERLIELLRSKNLTSEPITG